MQIIANDFRKSLQACGRVIKERNIMKKYWKLIVGAVAFAAFMVVVSIAYKNLSQEYKPQQNLVTQNTQEKSDDYTVQDDEAQDAEGSAGQQNGTANTSGNGTDADENTGGNGTGGDADESIENIAPDFTVENGDGEEVSLHDFFGKPIVLNFWASWCGPCKMELPDFQEAYEKYDGEVQFLMVNMTDGMQETKEIAMKFMDDAGYTLPVYYDTAQEAAYTYTVYSLPTTFFISAEGEPVAYAQGMIDAETLEKGISMIYP